MHKTNEKRKDEKQAQYFTHSISGASERMKITIYENCNKAHSKPSSKQIGIDQNIRVAGPTMAERRDSKFQHIPKSNKVERLTCLQ